MRVLLTGNLGYIGRVLSNYLSSFGYEIVGLDNHYYNYEFYGQESGVTSQHMRDIRDVEKEDLKGVEAIIHLAALSNDPLGEIDKKVTEEINWKATVRLATMAKEVGIRRFIFSSSCSVYGRKKGDKALTERDDTNALTAYALSKVLAEKDLLRLKDENFCPTLMRNATVYGLSPSLRLDLVVNNLVALGMLTGKVSIMSDGLPWRPIIHVKDLCQAFQVILNASEEKVTEQIYNIGRSKENWRIKEIGEQVGEELGCKVEILNKTGGDDRSYCVSFYKFLNSFVEFKPKWTLRLGIKELIVGYTEHGLEKCCLKSSEFFRLQKISELQKIGALDKELRWTKEKK